MVKTTQEERDRALMRIRQFSYDMDLNGEARKASDLLFGCVAIPGDQWELIWRYMEEAQKLLEILRHGE